MYHSIIINTALVAGKIRVFISKPGNENITIILSCKFRCQPPLVVRMYKCQGDPMMTSSGGNLIIGEVIRKGTGSTVWSGDH